MVCSELCKHGLGFVLVSVLVLIALAWPQALLLGPLSALESSRSICRVSNRVSVFIVSKYDKHIRANIGLHTYIYTYRQILIQLQLHLHLFVGTARICMAHTNSHQYIYFSTSRGSPNGIGFIRGPLKCPQWEEVPQCGSEICNPFREMVLSSRVYLHMP